MAHIFCSLRDDSEYGTRRHHPRPEDSEAGKRRDSFSLFKIVQFKNSYLVYFLLHEKVFWKMTIVRGQAS